MKNGALIGFGYWGQILSKTLKKNYPSLNLHVFDRSIKVRKAAFKQGFSVCSSLKEILESKKISFLIIATPPDTHYSLVKKGLESKKNILVEKPFGWYTENKSPLFQLAKQKKKTLMVDYTYLYSPGFQKLKKLLAGSKIKSYESLRMNSELARTDINVIDDLIIHDLSMILDIIPSKPLYCFCRFTGQKSKIAQQAFVFISGSHWQASIYGSRVWTRKTRTVIVRSPLKNISFEEKNKQTYVSVLNSGYIKKIKNKSSLGFMFEEFFKRMRKQSRSDDHLRYKKMSALLTALNKSMKLDGKNTKIHWEF